jgi:hypothetical protein
MKLSSGQLMIAASLAMFVMVVMGTFIPKRPDDISRMTALERSTAISGLSPKADLLLRTSVLVALTCVGILFFYSYRLDKSLACENDVVRLRRRWRTYHYSLIIAVFLVLVQLILAISGLFTVQHVNIAHILRSRLLDALMVLFILLSFLFLTRKYISAINALPASDVLVLKHKDAQL